MLSEFFPESVDLLQPDTGLFEGPCPILLEGCSFKNLALLLTGNRPKLSTSRIEFGANQAVLVSNEEAKKALPEELKHAISLTIFESKGLEFNDILLFNFFKNSQVLLFYHLITHINKFCKQINVLV